MTPLEWALSIALGIVLIVAIGVVWGLVAILNSIGEGINDMAKRR